MEVVPRELCGLADACLTSSQDVSDGWSKGQGALILDSRVAGNTQGGFDVVAAHGELVDAADIAIGRLVSVLEHDMDALYLCAFDFSATDEATATDFESTLFAGIFGG